jgi:stage II sporulation protein P
MRRLKKSTCLLFMVLLLSIYTMVSSESFRLWFVQIPEQIWGRMQSATMFITSLEFPAFAFAREYIENNTTALLQEQQDYEIAKEQTAQETVTEEETKETNEVQQTTADLDKSIITDQIVDFQNLSCYTQEQLQDFDYLVENLYQVHSSTTVYPEQLNATDLLATDLTIEKSQTEPQILIYHTHGSEYFADSNEDDPDTLITGVGTYLTQILEEDYGYQVLHDTTVFSYNESYSLGREKVTEYLTKYPSLEVIIDLHRDSAEGQHFVTEVNGKQTANIMFFNGMSQTSSGAIASRENPNLETNLAFSMQLKLAADEMFPGFARKNYLKAYRYNMHLAGRYALIEVGAETNTVEEVKNAMEPLAAVLNQVLQ